MERHLRTFLAAMVGAILLTPMTAVVATASAGAPTLLAVPGTPEDAKTIAPMYRDRSAVFTMVPSGGHYFVKNGSVLASSCEQTQEDRMTIRQAPWSNGPEPVYFAF